MIDYAATLKAVNAEIRQGRKIMEQLSTEKQPAYPFVEYTVTSPYLNPKTYKMGDGIREEVEMVISYTWFSKSTFEAMSLAQTSATLIKAQGTRQRLYDLGIVIVDVMGFGNRDTFLTIETERRVGFDVRIRITHTDNVTMDELENVTLDGAIVEG